MRLLATKLSLRHHPAITNHRVKGRDTHPIPRSSRCPGRSPPWAFAHDARGLRIFTGAYFADRRPRAHLRTAEWHIGSAAQARECAPAHRFPSKSTCMDIYDRGKGARATFESQKTIRWAGECSPETALMNSGICPTLDTFQEIGICLSRF